MSGFIGFMQFVIGPAGSGKTTYCKTIKQYCDSIKRSVYIVNLDPAVQKYLPYQPDFDIRDLVSQKDVMKATNLGPNGALVFCFQYLQKNMAIFEQAISQWGQDAYILVDCPGQIELYAHLDVMKNLVETVKNWGYNCASLYCFDSLNFTVQDDGQKFVPSLLVSMSAMMRMIVPHINVVTKCDKIQNKQEFQEQEWSILLQDPFLIFKSKNSGNKFIQKRKAFTKMLSDVIQNTGIQKFYSLDVSDQQSIEAMIMTVDHVIQYSQTLETKEEMYEF